MTGAARPRINNDLYEELGERWYSDDEHPIALLRAEAEVKLAYTRSLPVAFIVGPELTGGKAG